MAMHARVKIIGCTSCVWTGCTIQCHARLSKLSYCLFHKEDGFDCIVYFVALAGQLLNKQTPVVWWRDSTYQIQMCCILFATPALAWRDKGVQFPFFIRSFIRSITSILEAILLSRKPYEQTTVFIYGIQILRFIYTNTERIFAYDMTFGFTLFPGKRGIVVHWAFLEIHLFRNIFFSNWMIRLLW